MFKVYVLYSETFGKIYVGNTSDLDGRMLSHNFLGKKGYTLRFRPWQLVHTETFDSKPEAMKREKELKSAQGRKFIWDLVEKRGSSVG